MIKWLKKYKRDIITGTAVGLVLALLALFALPVTVSITGEGNLSIETNVALAVQSGGDYPVTEQRYSPGASLVFHSGFETGGFGEWPTVSGAPTVVEADGWGSPKTGTYAMRCNVEAAIAHVDSGLENLHQVSFYLYIASTPAAQVVIVGTGTTGIYLTADRYIRVYVSASLKITSSLQLNTETWYRISLSSSGSDSILYIDGSSDDGGTTNVETLLDGEIGIIASATADLYFDDCVWGNASSTDDLGDIRVLRASPNAEGTDQNTGTGEDWQDLDDNPATYDHVDNIPLVQTADYDWAEADGVMMRYTTGLQSLTDLGISGATIEAVNFIWYYETGGGGGVDQYYKIIYDQSQRTQVSIDDPTDPTLLQSYEADCPSDSDAWTEEVFDACEMGMATNDANKDLWWYSGVAMVAYIPAAACSEDITNSPTTWSVNGGTPVATSSEYATGLTHFTVTNNSGGTIDISISGTDMSGGNTWTLSDTATPGSMIYGLKAGLDGGDYTIIVKKSSPYNDLVTGLADSGTQDWGLKLYTPTEYTDGVTKSGTVTLTATCQ